LEEDGYKQIDKNGRTVKIVKGPVGKDQTTENDMDIIRDVKYHHMLVDALDAQGNLLLPC